METKKCNKCQEELSLDRFYKNKGTKDGVETYCKSCKGISTLKSAKKYYLENKEYILAQKKIYNKKYREGNREAVRLSQKKFRENNVGYSNKYSQKKKQEDPIFKFSGAVRVLLYTSFKRACNGAFTKRSRSVEMLGCSMEDFVSHIVSQFTEGMTLENHGEWHLDHIIPLATARSEDDVIRLSYYKNFQPLWASDNLSKGCKLAK
jgi:hypothetical protein